MKLFRPPPYPVILFAAAAAGVVAAQWVADREAAAARLAAELAAQPTEPGVSENDAVEVAAPPIDEPELVVEEVAADDWDADAEWEGELAYRVLSDQGAFDVEEIDLPATEVEAEAEPIRELEFAQVLAEKPRESDEIEATEATEVAEHHEPEPEPELDPDPSEFAGLPRQALFEMAKELGVPMKDLIVMDREQLIDAIERAAPDRVRTSH